MNQWTPLALLAMAHLIPMLGLQETIDQGESCERARRQITFSEIVTQAIRTGSDVALWAADDSVRSVLASDLREPDDADSSRSKFRPILEAELPEGFPTPQGLGEIQLRKYPAYRKAMARVDGENGTFMTLFRHIKANDIAMTAPVEMTLNESGDSMQDMSFLYKSLELGQTGQQGTVEVIDVPAGEYLSIGFRGDRNDKEIKQGMRKLTEWVENRDDYRASGHFRVMGYNSPFLPRFMRYWELQLPIAEVNEDDSVEAIRPESNDF